MSAPLSEKELAEMDLWFASSHPELEIINLLKRDLRAARAELEVIKVLDEVHAIFQALPHREKNDPEFSLNLLDQQIIEAREHLAAGQMDKMVNEIADCVSVAWQAFYWFGRDPRKTIIERVRTRIIPRARELAERDRKGNGYKDGRGAMPEK